MTLEGYDGCGALQPAEWWTDRCKVCHHSLMLHKDVVSEGSDEAPPSAMMVCDMCALAADVAIALKEHVRDVDYKNRKDTEEWMKQRMPAVIVEKVKEESLKEEQPSEPSEPVAAEPASELPSAEPSETAPSTPSEPAPSPESPASSEEPSTTSSTTPKK